MLAERRFLTSSVSLYALRFKTRILESVLCTQPGIHPERGLRRPPGVTRYGGRLNTMANQVSRLLPLWCGPGRLVLGYTGYHNYCGAPHSPHWGPHAAGAAPGPPGDFVDPGTQSWTGNRPGHFGVT